MLCEQRNTIIVTRASIVKLMHMLTEGVQREFMLKVVGLCSETGGYIAQFFFYFNFFY